MIQNVHWHWVSDSGVWVNPAVLEKMPIQQTCCCLPLLYRTWSQQKKMPQRLTDLWHVDTSLEGQRGSKLSHSTDCMFSKIQCRETETFAINRTELNWPVFRVPHLLPNDSCDRLGGRVNELNWIPFLETKFMIIHNRKKTPCLFVASFRRRCKTSSCATCSWS